MTALQAIRERDAAALMVAFSGLQEAEAFKTEILPLMDPGDCKWFWTEVLSPEQFEHLVSQVRDTCSLIARKAGLEFGKDYTCAVDGFGDPIMIVSPELHSVFYDTLSPARHSVLRFYLHNPMT